MLFATVNGIVKRVSLEEFKRINCNGKKAVTFKEDDQLLDVKVTNGETKILLASDEGKLCMFNETDVRAMGRNAAGVRGMNLKEGSKLVSVSTDQYGKLVFVLSENGLGKLSPIEDYRLTNRGAGGVITIKVTEKTGKLVGMKVINGDEDYIVITNNGQTIRSPIEQVRLCGRNSIGVKIINLKDKETVSSFTVLPHEDSESQEENTEVNNAESVDENNVNQTENTEEKGE